MTRRYRYFAVAVATVLATASPAKACSCASEDARERLEAADAAIVATALTRTPSGEGTVTYTFRVDEEIKGDFEATVEVRTASDGAACGLEVGIGEQTGLFLSGSHANGWRSSLCQQISPEELREAARPMPEPDGEGPIRTIAGGDWGDMGLFALDAQGRTLMYGRRERGSSVADVCPGSTLFLEVPWRGRNRWVVRRTATFEIVEVVHRPRGAWPETCLTEDASEVLVHAIHYGEPRSTSRLYRYGDGTFEQLYEGSSSGFEVVGDHVYLTEGRYGRNVRMLDLATGAKTFVARVPRYVQGVSASPDEMHLATTAGADREKLVAIDTTTSPPTVLVKDHGIGMSGEVYWLDDARFVYLPGGYDNDKVKIFDAELNRETTLGGHWYTLDEELLGDVAYGAGWGVIYRAELPSGPAEVLREFPSSEIYTLGVVADEVHAQPEP
ncbi:MAG: hypothetical protein M3271_08725 [Actinomycetota bacterium]|nr:hypothetical protein [Actinomycetota bacterium]